MVRWPGAVGQALRLALQVQQLTQKIWLSGNIKVHSPIYHTYFLLGYIFELFSFLFQLLGGTFQLAEDNVQLLGLAPQLLGHSRQLFGQDALLVF